MDRIRLMLSKPWPNQYYDADFNEVLYEVNNWFDTPTDIAIYTGKLDFEDDLWGGKFGTGVKYSQVVSDNTFLVYDEMNGEQTQNDTLSNIFNYDEKVYAAYAEYSKQLEPENSGSRPDCEQSSQTQLVISRLFCPNWLNHLWSKTI